MKNLICVAIITGSICVIYMAGCLVSETLRTACDMAVTILK